MSMSSPLPDNSNLPTSNQPATILGTTITVLSIASITLSLRLWVRLRDHLWGWDDAFVVLAGIASFAADIMMCQMPDDGLGLHLWTLEGSQLIGYFKHVYSTNCAYAASATLIKLSILFQYLRLFAEAAPSSTSSAYRLAKRLTWCMIVLCSIWGLIFFPLAVFPCHPIEKNWNPGLKGSCIGWGTKDPNVFYPMFLGHSISNAVLDTLVLLLPVPFMTSLRIAGKSRAGLVGLFTLGSCVVVVAMGRLVALSIDRAGTVPALDMTFHTPIIFLFAVLEVNFAIIAASIPIFWPAIATLATNKIFVVNEVEIHVEEASRHESFDSNGGISLNDRKCSPCADIKSGMVAATVPDHVHGQSGEILGQVNHARETSATTSIGQPMGMGYTGRKASIASTIGYPFAELGSSPSQDSSHYFYETSVKEDRSPQSIAKTDEDDWFAAMDRVNSHGQMAGPVHPGAMPFEHMQASDNK